MAREGSQTRVVRVETIQSLMDSQNISKTELARVTGLSLKQIHNILNRISNPREDTIIRIAAALGVRWRTLLEEHEGEPQETGQVGVGTAVQTTVDVLVETSADLDPAELERRLMSAIKKLGPERSKIADIIRIIMLRPEDEI
jgi:transcriptional regulator with XRE-family HTH domain